MVTTKKTTSPAKGTKTETKAPVKTRTAAVGKKPVEKKALAKKPAAKTTPKTTKKPVKEVPVYTVPAEVKKLGEYFKLLRLEKGMTIVDLSERCCVGKTTIGEFEKGLACPKIDTVMKIASALGYKLQAIMK